MPDRDYSSYFIKLTGEQFGIKPPEPKKKNRNPMYKILLVISIILFTIWFFWLLHKIYDK